MGYWQSLSTPFGLFPPLSEALGTVDQYTDLMPLTHNRFFEQLRRQVRKMYVAEFGDDCQSLVQRFLDQRAHFFPADAHGFAGSVGIKPPARLPVRVGRGARSAQVPGGGADARVGAGEGGDGHLGGPLFGAWRLRPAFWIGLEGAQRHALKVNL